MVESWYHFCADFSPVAGGEDTEQVKAAAELYNTVSQHTGRYINYFLSAKMTVHKQNFFF